MTLPSYNTGGTNYSAGQLSMRKSKLANFFVLINYLYYSGRDNPPILSMF